ncbi:MAG: SEL1-like repeat protein [Gammaproteobacteria bacterium]|nr:SEL1-like repeat protein [Gammaproteobacteria bacterium]
MAIKAISYLLFIIASLSAFAGNLEDADQRLFQVQMTLAEKGDARAQYYLGEMHEQGLGTKQNVDEAFKWYAKAAERGDPMAKRKLSMRPEIEADVKKDQAAEAIIKASIAPVQRSSPSIEKRQKAPAPLKNIKAPAPVAVPAVVAQAPAEDEEAKRQQQILAAAVAREKRRAAVRAMILERMRNPVGAPFE